MKTYTKEELAAVINEHGKWLRNEGGSRANLSGSNLSGSNLSGANLSWANLSGADLSKANLSKAVHAWAQVAFKGHGECGRMLTAVIYAEGQDAVYQCGCFSGSLSDIKAYIKKGEQKHRKSRTLAMTTVTKLLSI